LADAIELLPKNGARNKARAADAGQSLHLRPRHLLASTDTAEPVFEGLRAAQGRTRKVVGFLRVPHGAVVLQRLIERPQRHNGTDSSDLFVDRDELFVTVCFETIGLHGSSRDAYFAGGSFF
jgi:hypothetical protein